MRISFYFVLILTSFSITSFSQEFSDPSRTEYKNDAGEQGSKSGFFQAYAPVNFPAGAGSWWHLLDVRHTNPNNNFAMQFAGSFFDGNLYFRKTNNNPSQSWSKVLLASNGNVDVQENSVNIATGANVSYRAGAYFSAGNMSFLNAPYISFNALLTTSDISSSVNAFTPTWNAGGGMIMMGEGGGSGLHFLQKNYANGTPPYNLNSFSENFTLSSNGNVGIGTASPSYKLDVLGGGSGNVNLRVNGRIQTGDASGGGGVWLGNDQTGFVGNNEANIGFWTNGVGWSAFQIQKSNGFIGIGTINPTERLSVNGNIRAKKIIVTTTGWADYVFDNNYTLRSLTSVENFIKQYKHLPDVPAAKEVEKGGLDVGLTEALLLKKIEELTLYVIEQNKQILNQNEKIELLQKKIGEFGEHR